MSRHGRWMDRALIHVGTLVALAWALHAIVHYHDVSLLPDTVPPE